MMGAQRRDVALGSLRLQPAAADGVVSKARNLRGFLRALEVQ